MVPRSARALAAAHRLTPLAAALPADEAAIAAEPGAWRTEVFWQGHRVIAARVGDEVGLFADDLKDWTPPATAIALALRDLPADPLVLEGWLCVLDAQGRPDFEQLQRRMTAGHEAPLLFMVSDAQVVNTPLADLPLRERRARLTALIPPGHRTLLPPQELEGALPDLKRSLEGLWLDAVLVRPELGPRPAFVVSINRAPVPLSRPLSAAPKVTNPQKVLFPRDGFTKHDVAAWYRAVAPALLPYLQGRPVVGQRWPDGIDDFTWFQHRVPPRAPDYVKSVRVGAGGARDRRMLLETEDALMWMVNQAVLTFHGWASRVGTRSQPDWAIIDLDPGPRTTWPQVIEVALAVRALLELLEVPSVVKTSGQKGLHVLVPLGPGHTAQQATSFAQGVCGLVAQLKPELVSLDAETGPRRGRLFLDTLQNYEGKTLVLPWSLRAVDGAPVSMPLAWSEVTPSLDPKAFTLRTARARLDAVGDLFAPALEGTLSLEPVLRRLAEGR